VGEGVGSTCASLKNSEVDVNCVTPTFKVPTPPPKFGPQAVTLRLRAVATYEARESTPYVMTFAIVP
jgi:hypothetical protein